MKRTREFTAIHYRRSIKRPASLVLQSPCPVCGSPLEATLSNDLGETQRGGVKTGSKTAFRVAQQESRDPTRVPQLAPGAEPARQ